MIDQIAKEVEKNPEIPFDKKLDLYWIDELSLVNKEIYNLTNL